MVANWWLRHSTKRQHVFVRKLIRVSVCHVDICVYFDLGVRVLIQGACCVAVSECIVFMLYSVIVQVCKLMAEYDGWYVATVSA